MVDKDRLASTFMTLVRVDSPSRREGALARILAERLSALGAEVFFDAAGPVCGSDTGNLVARFPGAEGLPPLLLNAHMDTVQPGEGIVPVLEDGVFKSAGETILGADDKSAIAVLLETLTVLLETGSPRPPLEVVLTICEEVGLLGAKAMDPGLVTAPYGYALDASDPDGIVVRAPAANKLSFVVHGKAAHAGAVPEQGINAIQVAAAAIASLPLGRLDGETTCNLGVIHGGVATNIVPEKVEVLGEARSHNPAKLQHVTDRMVQAFSQEVDRVRKERGADDGLPTLQVAVDRDFPCLKVPGDHPLVAAACKAAERLGRTMALKTSGGGADANIFFDRGIPCGVLGTGMEDMHTTRETVALKDMEKAAALLVEIVRLHGKNAVSRESSD
ncbi:MAG: M20/M25/M40 family metallo-hydrolase [Deltaproteobacteria bacterium]|nr:M20/M25/M40 family metallo-hydrolase [Deltaproteobacteria bacterium]